MSEGQIIPPVRLRIAGTAALPTIGDVIGVHASLSTGAIFSTQVAAAQGPDRVRPGLRTQRHLHPAAARRQPGGRAALARADRRAAQQGRGLAAGHESLFGDIGQYMQFVSVLPVQRPAEIVNYRTMGAMPAILAGGLRRRRGRWGSA